MHAVTGAALAGAILDLAMLALARGRLTSARPLGTALYTLANIAFATIVALAIDPSASWAPVALAIPLVTGAVILRDWSAPARACFAMLATGGAYVTYVASLTFLSGLGPLAMLLSAVLLVFEVAALALALVYAFEGFAVLARVRWRRRVAAPPAFDPASAPFVSIHIPTYSEPPELVIETLDSLAALDYPGFEVIVVDNNTKDPALWTPVERHCAALGPRFRFYHVDPLDGFKAGACNFALERTDDRAELIAIVDADYTVDPAFLRETTPHFRDRRVAFVQTPQDYREFEGNRYLTDCLHAYAYFFAVTMVARNEDGAPIFGGTMGIIRRAALEEIGGWDTWCITEDAEASLRLLRRGYEGLYVAKSYGRGLMPFDFDSYKKQRFRWAFGGIQILRKHWRSLLPLWPRPGDDRLTSAQRRWYLAGALLWCGELLQLAFLAFLVAGALAYVLRVGVIARPVAEAALLFPLLFLVLGLARFLWLLRSALRLSVRDAIGAATSMFSLSWVVTVAVLSALVHRDGVFLRTSKTRSQATLVRALAASRSESLLAAVSLVAAVGAIGTGMTSLTVTFAVLCAWQACVYGSAFATSLSAIRSAGSDARPVRYRRSARPPRPRSRRFAPAFAGAGAVIVFALLATVALAPVVGDELTAASERRPPLLPPALLPPPSATPAPTPAPARDATPPPPPTAITIATPPATARARTPAPTGAPTASASTGPRPPSAPPATAAPTARPTPTVPAPSQRPPTPTPPVPAPGAPTPSVPTPPVPTPPAGGQARPALTFTPRPSARPV